MGKLKINNDYFSIIISKLELYSYLNSSIKILWDDINYLVQTLYACLKGTTRDKGAVVRVMVSRAEVDMNEIQRVFKKKYGVELKNAVSESLPSGDYRELVLALETKICTATAGSP